MPNSSGVARWIGRSASQTDNGMAFHETAPAAVDVRWEKAEGSATGVGRYARNLDSTSPRVRAYELQGDVPDDLEDNILSTVHQRTVDEDEHPVDRGTRESQDLDRIRQEQSFPHGR